jgi:hypothetical protein
MNCSMNWTKNWMSNWCSKNWINRLNLESNCLEAPDLSWKSGRHWMDCCLTALRIPRKTTRVAAVASSSWTRVAAVAEAVCWNWMNRLKSCWLH